MKFPKFINFFIENNNTREEYSNEQANMKGNLEIIFTCLMTPISDTQSHGKASQIVF